MLQQNFFDAPITFNGLVLPKIQRISESGDEVPCNLWDIPNTIRELSYLTHSHYRYYGKFPSAVAGQLLTQYLPPTPEHYVLDNFCGSGTTLVEAKLRGICSYGVDISWISALVSRVKCRHINLKLAREYLVSFLSQNKFNITEQEPSSFATKWFSESAINGLCEVRSWLQTLPLSPERDFLLVAFLAIIRRVSKAHDAEVRPHINASKKEREVRSAFVKKVEEMIDDHQNFQYVTDADIRAECFVANNTALPSRFSDRKCYLAISHPPYLNSFNYRPVFSLEFYWGSPFEADYASTNEMGLIANELVAHPATEVNTERYFAHLSECYRSIYEIQDRNAKLAIVIGDCTRNGKLIPVLERTISLAEDIGYRLIEKNFRTTHYGLGKYAYKHRADYHGEEEEKRDGILVFER